MASWANRLEELDTTVLNTFAVAAIFTPQSTGEPQAISGVIANPAMYEDYTPGSLQAVSVIRLFVRFADISPSPQKGDQISINGANYDLFEVDADPGGGAVLKLRLNS
jgi:hypothetical protein